MDVLNQREFQGSIYNNIPWLDSQEMLLLSEIDPKQKLADLIYNIDLHSNPYIDDTGQESMKGKSTKGAGFPLIPAAIAGLTTALPVIKNVASKYGPKLLKAAASIFSGITNLTRKRGRGVTPSNFGSGVRPANILGGALSPYGFTHGFLPRLGKWLKKNGRQMDRDEEIAAKGGNLAEIRNTMGKWLKKAFEGVNRLSNSAAKVLRERVLDKIMPFAKQVGKSAINQIHRVKDKIGETFNTQDAIAQGQGKGYMKHMLGHAYGADEIRQMMKRPEMQQLITEHKFTPLTGSGIMDSLGSLFESGTSLLSKAGEKMPDMLSKFGDTIGNIDFSKYGITPGNISKGMQAITGLSSSLLQNKDIRKAFDKKQKQLHKMLRELEKKGLIGDISKLVKMGAIGDDDDEETIPRRRKNDKKHNDEEEMEEEEEEEEYESPPPRRRKQKPKISPQTYGFGDQKKKTQTTSRGRFKVSLN